MRDSGPMKAERAMQLSFRKMEFVQGLTIFLAVLLFAEWQLHQRNREELGWRATILDLRPISIGGWTSGGLQLAGAWTLSSPDPRFGGISALALFEDRFVAIARRKAQHDPVPFVHLSAVEIEIARRDARELVDRRGPTNGFLGEIRGQ